MFIQRYPFSLSPLPLLPLSPLDKRRPAFSIVILFSYRLISFSCHLPLGSMYFLSCSRDGMVWLLYSTVFEYKSLLKMVYTYGHMVCSSQLGRGMAPFMPIKRWYVGVWYGMFFSIRLRTGTCQEMACWGLVWYVPLN
jgi:hypothetical protein